MTDRITMQSSDNDASKKPDIEQRILERTAHLSVPSGMSREEALSVIRKKISESSYSGKHTVKRILKPLFWYSMAAGILLLFGIWRVGFFSPLTEVVADNGSHIDYRLPDGSQVILNSDSKLTYDKKNFNRNRHLTLDGEAFCNIAKGEKFIISTKQVEIEILGTSFNVFSRDDELKVSCLSGKILVTSVDKSVTIIPGESVSLRNNQLNNYKDKNINTADSWINGEFYFENAPLNSIIKEIERQFNVKFEVQKIDEKYFTGSFTNNSLVDALEIVCIPLGLKYEIGRKDKIIISEKPH
jgi:ferric-dicitrate binding protein FerR (iron transport regulator)